MSNKLVNSLRQENAEVVVISARAEEEISELDDEDKGEVFGSSWFNRIWRGQINP